LRSEPSSNRAGLIRKRLKKRSNLLLHERGIASFRDLRAQQFLIAVSQPAGGYPHRPFRHLQPGRCLFVGHAVLGNHQEGLQGLKEFADSPGLLLLRQAGEHTLQQCDHPGLIEGLFRRGSAMHEISLVFVIRARPVNGQVLGTSATLSPLRPGPFIGQVILKAREQESPKPAVLLAQRSQVVLLQETGEEAVRKYKKGDDLDTVVLAIDPERERISLGVKQLQDDPFNNYVSVNEKGAIVKGKVTSMDAKSATITLADDVTGILKSSDVSRDKVEDIRNVLKEGEEVEAKIVTVDRKNRQIGLSIKAKDMADEKDAIKEMRAKAADQMTPATIGDLIKAQMEK